MSYSTIKKVFLSAGHSNVIGVDNGAIGVDGVKEGDLTVCLRKKIIAAMELFDQQPLYDKDENATVSTVKIIKSVLSSKDIAIDFHFNASSKPYVTGTEVLIPFSSTQIERELAYVLSSNIANLLGIQNRGVKTEALSSSGRLMFMRPNCENVLVEICFITNPNDMKAYYNKEDDLAILITRCIIAFITQY